MSVENVPEIEITTKAHSGITALDCSVYYYGKWASKVQWVKIVGDSWTNVTANESESEIRKTPALILTQFSSLIKIPTNSVTEHFICNVTISEYHRPNTTIYAWKSLECGLTIELSIYIYNTITHILCIVIVLNLSISYDILYISYICNQVRFKFF